MESILQKMIGLLEAHLTQLPPLSTPLLPTTQPTAIKPHILTDTRLAPLIHPPTLQYGGTGQHARPCSFYFLHFPQRPKSFFSKILPLRPHFPVTTPHTLTPQTHPGHPHLCTSLLRELHRLVAKHPLLIGGYFNSQHTDWGYKTTTHRGRRLWLLLQNLQLSVHNNFQTPTRIGNSVSMYTSPDLVLSCSLRDVTWTRTQHTLGSDHYIIQVTVPFKPPRHTYMTHKLINWEALRTTRTASHDNPITDINDWVDSLQTDIQHHTQQIETTTDVPTQDTRLAHLW
ncbi:hypothetical protein HPB49_007615 [Dermacentor silvarum]|uniref:Uncharacterized protein n=1 Tax=Dermacentor silvarum TaxID=543639 RepID=A0ACB8DBS2_DERSI|nr:hypothetical protein HPB49_007615 [Dermacentor silvarum]